VQAALAGLGSNVLVEMLGALLASMGPPANYLGLRAGSRKVSAMNQATTRRGFLRATSLGAATTGLVAALPTIVVAQEQPPESSTSGVSPACPAQPIPLGASQTVDTPFTVYVNSPVPGQAVIYIGEREIPITDTSVVQYLRQAAGA